MIVSIAVLRRSCCSCPPLYNLKGLHDLASNKLIQFIFDSCSLAIAKKLLSASVCKYSDAPMGPYLAANASIGCGGTEQISLALLGAFGMVVWFTWIVVLVERKSSSSQPINNLLECGPCSHVVMTFLRVRARCGWSDSNVSVSRVVGCEIGT